MCQHESKTCPRCHQIFECRVGNITHCGCTDIILTKEEIALVESRYQDCLCVNCLKDMKNRTVFFTEKFFFRSRSLQDPVKPESPQEGV